MEKINLSQTAELMSSENYKERFIAEYAQIAIRTKRLSRVLKSIEDKTAPACFKLTCDIDILDNQLKFMIIYKSILTYRAELEGIELPEVEI